MMNTTLPNAPRVILSNDLTLVNFSSPHPFVFTDGSILPVCSPERVRGLSLERTEVDFVHEKKSWRTVLVAFYATKAVQSELELLEQDTSIDVIIVPRPLLEALRASDISIGKARTVLVADRQNKINFIDRFCV